MAATEPTETETESVPAIRWLDEPEAHDAFDAKARTWLGISGEEFLRRWDAGEYPGIDDDDDENYILVASLISLVRP